MAERVGFEPTNELPHCWFSRPVLSTAQPSLHVFNIFFYKITQPQFTFLSYTLNLVVVFSIKSFNSILDTL